MSQGGTKHDQNKPRMDLLCPSFTRGVAEVLTFGAKKYSKYGECSCGVKDVKEIEKYGLKDFVNPAIIQRIKEKTKRDTTSTRESIEEKIVTGLENIDDNIYSTIPRSLRKSVGTILKGNTGSTMQNSMSSLVKKIALFVDRQINCVSTTTTIQEEFEKDFVKDATLLWDSLKNESGNLKHTGTCESTKVIQSGADNWRKGIKYSRIIGAIHRHLASIQEGEDIDPESGLPHIYHIGCNAQFLGWMMKERPDLDDRWKNEDQN